MFLATTLPYLPKSQPAGDPLRFSLPGASWLLLLAAAAVSVLLPALRTDAGAVARRLLYTATAAAILGLAVPRSPADLRPRPWAWEGEYAFLVAELPPPGSGTASGTASGTGWYDATQDPNGAFGLWMQLRTGLPWKGWGAGRPAPGDVVYRGTADRLAGEWKGARCGLDVLKEAEVAPLSDGWVEFGPEPVVLALYAVRDCQGIPEP